MRDIERIERIMGIFKEIWTLVPDMRFNQLIDVLQHEYCNVEGVEYFRKYAQIEPISNFENGVLFNNVLIPDLFYLEDDEFEKFLISYLKSIKEGGISK